MEDQWRLTVSENIGAGLLALDPAGRILHMNLEGRYYVDLLQAAGLADILALRDHLLEEARNDSPVEQVNCEVLLEGPPQRILRVSFQPVLVDGWLESWILILRDAVEGLERDAGVTARREKRVVSVVHWPPASPATSNLP